jgi:hypothetical protein
MTRGVRYPPQTTDQIRLSYDSPEAEPRRVYAVNGDWVWCSTPHRSGGIIRPRHEIAEIIKGPHHV